MVGEGVTEVGQHECLTSLHLNLRFQLLISCVMESAGESPWMKGNDSSLKNNEDCGAREKKKVQGIASR